MQDILQTFLEQPSARNYRAARRAILSDPEYRGDVTLLIRVTDLCERGRFDDALQCVERMMPDWALSPRTHCLAAIAAEAEGDPADAELERFLATSCFQGILATGSGSPHQPFQVMHVSDEYDVVDWLGICNRDDFPSAPNVAQDHANVGKPRRGSRRRRVGTQHVSSSVHNRNLPFEPEVAECDSVDRDTNGPLRVVGQQVVAADSGRMDVLTLNDGCELWFELDDRDAEVQATRRREGDAFLAGQRATSELRLAVRTPDLGGLSLYDRLHPF